MRKIAIFLIILMMVGVGLLSGCNEQQKNTNGGIDKNGSTNNKFVGTWTDRDNPTTQVIFRVNGTLTMISEGFNGLTKSNGTYKILNNSRMDWDFGSWTWKNSYYKFISDDILILQMNLAEGNTYTFDRTK